MYFFLYIFLQTCELIFRDFRKMIFKKNSKFKNKILSRHNLGDFQSIFWNFLQSERIRNISFLIATNTMIPLFTASIMPHNELQLFHMHHAGRSSKLLESLECLYFASFWTLFVCFCYKYPLLIKNNSLRNM